MLKEASLTQRDLVGLVLSYVYAFGLLLGVEAIGKRLRWPHYLTRKLVHIGAGMWIWGILALFSSWKIGIIPFASFIVLNYVFYRFQSFKAMDTADSSPGTVYFAISITVLLVLLWRDAGPVDRVPIAVAAVMAMTWGDGMASIVGQSIGRRQYTVFGHQRSWEGTTAMAITTALVVLITLLVLSASKLSPLSVPLSFGRALAMTVVATAVATFAEGLSPAGTDNLTVPLVTAAVLGLFVL